MFVGLKDLANPNDSLRYSPFLLVTVPSPRKDGSYDPRRKCLGEFSIKETSDDNICYELS
ncbi:hypothetical protein BMW23_0345 [Bodo saltans virus]|uniref:Uncharacterized protein n=1 Tax=Bodo saltans virus TaxID=2024608 RepID=A0A2H4UTY4_9VIRU|nr:hypothetical protein QJ851_gp0337 [Bodo saltans virus]ATZ80400.1 hypothetical protein BMW23_0345 [Bodo saltans virus]